jgi:hypothetical protein
MLKIEIMARISVCENQTSLMPEAERKEDIV